MLLAGDEFAHTQYGNNNVYCQDNPLAWIDWERAESASSQAQAAFVRRLLLLRRRYALLRRNRFLDRAQGDAADIHWLSPDGEVMREADWHDSERRALTIVLDGRRPDSGLGEPGRHVSLALLVNTGTEPQTHRVVLDGMEFRKVLLQTPEAPLEQAADGSWALPARSLCLLAASSS